MSAKRACISKVSEGGDFQTYLKMVQTTVNRASVR